MNNVTCTITFANPGKTAVKIAYTPQIDKAFRFQAGDTITFTSKDAPWKVGYNSSPFTKNGGTVSFEGAAGQTEVLPIQREGRFPFDCGLWNGVKYAGYGEGGGDPTNSGGH